MPVLQFLIGDHPIMIILILVILGCIATDLINAARKKG